MQLTYWGRSDRRLADEKIGLVADESDGAIP